MQPPKRIRPRPEIGIRQLRFSGQPLTSLHFHSVPRHSPGALPVPIGFAENCAVLAHNGSMAGSLKRRGRFMPCGPVSGLAQETRWAKKKGNIPLKAKDFEKSARHHFYIVRSTDLTRRRKGVAMTTKSVTFVTSSTKMSNFSTNTAFFDAFFHGIRWFFVL